MNIKTGQTDGDWDESIKKAIQAIPTLSREELEVFYRGTIILCGDLFKRYETILEEKVRLELQLSKMGVTPCTKKEQCKIIQMPAR